MTKKNAAKVAAPTPGGMRLVLRSDLGGRAASIPALLALSGIEITAPMVLFAGGNGAGKSSLFAALRRATGLVGTGIGRFPKYGGSDGPLPLPSSWQEERQPADLARHALMAGDRIRRWDRDEVGHLPDNAVGVLDPISLGWKGQRVWLHDGRSVDAHDSIRGDFDMTSMRRSADDRLRSHGEQMTGRLRYAIAWALGLFDLRDPYDGSEADKGDRRREFEDVPREIFRRLAGHAPNDPARTEERWLLLDEPETGLDPVVFARLLAVLAENAAEGRLRVLCVTHSPLAFGMAGQPGIQVIDMDGYAARLDAASRTMSDPRLRAAAASEEMSRLVPDAAAATSEDRGLNGQGRFTAHEALSVPYPEAIKAPYGDPRLLRNMRSSVQSRDEGPRPSSGASSRPAPEEVALEDQEELDEDDRPGAVPRMR